MVALGVGRELDRRAQILLYKAGSRVQVHESTVPFTSDWARLYSRLRLLDREGLSQAGVSLDILPTPVDWCQVGDAVQIGQETWSFRTFTESCSISSGVNTSYELCPPGASDVSQCIVPPKLETGCWDDPPRLVGVYSVGDALWAVAERPHGATIPRFAAGVMKR